MVSFAASPLEGALTTQSDRLPETADGDRKLHVWAFQNKSVRLVGGGQFGAFQFQSWNNDWGVPGRLKNNYAILTVHEK